MASDNHSVRLSNKLKFLNYAVSEKLKFTPQRKLIVDAFLAVDRHISVEEFYHDLRKKVPNVGFSTVYRTFKLMVESGIACDVIFEGSPTLYYEQVRENGHHGHLICTRCKTISDYRSASIENLQNEIATNHGFLLENSRFEIHGLCSGCRH